MFALNLLASLLAASIASASPITEDATLTARQTNWTCPNFGQNNAGQLIVTSPDKNGRCCMTGFSYIWGEGREACCRNDPALLEHEHYKYALPCDSKWWSTADNALRLRSCNLDGNYRCRAECDNVPWLYPEAKPCPAKN